MREAKFHIDDPAFSEFVYSLLYNASIEARRVIPPKYLKFIKYEREAKRFARTATTDEARVLLAYLGVEHFQVFVAKDVVTFKDLKGVLEKFKEKKKIGALQDLIDLKLFVTSDKELVTLLGLVAQTIHHKAYTMNLELTRTGYHSGHWGKHLPTEPSSEIQENTNELAKILLSSALTLERTEFLFSLTPLDIKVLLYLYPLKHTHIEFRTLFAHFAGSVTVRKLSNSVKSLLQGQYLQKSALTNGKDYTISALGVRTVNEYLNAVIHATSFR